MKVIVEECRYDAGRWFVRMPDMPSNIVWSEHESQHAAAVAAQDDAEAMGYDGVEMRS